MEFLCWDVPPHETSPMARSEEKRLFSQVAYTTQMFKISITWFCILDASAAAAVSITQSPWIWPSNNSRNAIRQHDARLPSTTTANTKIQSLQTSSPTARLVTHAVPCTTTAITYAGTICHGSTVTYGTSTCRTVTNATATSCVMWYKALKINLWHKMHNSYKIILQILCSVIASSKLEEEFCVVTRTRDTNCVIQHGIGWLYYIMQRLRKQPTCFVMSANSFPGKWCLRNECRKSVLMMSQGTWSGECFWFFSPSVWIKIILFLHSFLSLHLAGKLLVTWPNVHATYKIVMHNTKMLWHKIRGIQIMTSCSRILTVFIERFPIVPFDIRCYI